MLSNKELTDPQAPDGSPIDPSGLTANPILAALLQQNPDLMAELMGGGAGGVAQPQSLEEALMGTSLSMVGRQALTGSTFKGSLPPWATDLSPEILSNPDFDPYLGVVSQGGDERVYMGTKTYKQTPPAPFDPTEAGASRPSGDGVEFRSGATPDQTVTKKEKGPKTLTSTQAKNLPYTWTEEEVADAMQKMQGAGIAVKSFDDMLGVWGSMVDRAAMTYGMSSGERKVTPWDVLDLYKAEAKASGTFQDLNGTKTTTSRSVSDVTEGEAWSSLQGTLSQLLGRDPNDQELRDFTYRMNQQAAANPSISKTITQFKNGEAVSSNTHTSGGFTAGDVAQAAYEGAQDDKGYAEYQSATTYYNAAISALGAIGQV
jgi:hypothetical protein